MTEQRQKHFLDDVFAFFCAQTERGDEAQERRSAFVEEPQRFGLGGAGCGRSTLDEEEREIEKRIRVERQHQSGANRILQGQATYEPVARMTAV